MFIGENCKNIFYFYILCWKILYKNFLLHYLDLLYKIEFIYTVHVNIVERFTCPKYVLLLKKSCSFINRTVYCIYNHHNNLIKKCYLSSAVVKLIMIVTLSVSIEAVCFINLYKYRVLVIDLSSLLERQCV